MGEPAEVSGADRAATRALANRILRSVHDDERMPVPPSIENMRSRDRADVETWLFDLALEIVTLTAELAIAQARVVRGKDTP